VVDDDKSMRMLLRLALEQEGYQVLEAQDGTACLAAYQHQKPDAILLDAVMPGMDGFACCTELRRFRGSTVPVLMITVLDDPDSVEQAFAVGATDYITKPIHWAVLRHRLRCLLEQSRLSKQLEQANLELERLACLVASYEERGEGRTPNL
jgi:PleD family two-component response regulator